MSEPRTLFQPRSFPRVQTVIVTRESATNWWVKSGDREERLFKKGYDGKLFPTFEEAKAFGVAREQRIVAQAEAKLARVKIDLAKWEALIEAAPVDAPITYKSGTLKV